MWLSSLVVADQSAMQVIWVLTPKVIIADGIMPEPVTLQMVILQSMADDGS